MKKFAKQFKDEIPYLIRNKIITPLEGIVLYLFNEENNGYPSRPMIGSYADIGNRLGLDKSNMFRIVKSLLANKLIEKNGDEYYVVDIENYISNRCNGDNVLSTKQKKKRCNNDNDSSKTTKRCNNDNETVVMVTTHRCNGDNGSYLYNSTRLKADNIKEDNKDNYIPKKVYFSENENCTEIANVSEIAIQQPGIITGRIKPNYDDPFQKLVEYNAKYRNESFRPENLLAFKKCVDLIIGVWDASRRGDERKARKAFAESVVEDCYSADLIERFEQAFYAYSKDEFQKKVKAMSLEKWASQWDNWTEVYVERTRNNEIKKIDPAGSYWILIREKLKG